MGERAGPALPALLAAVQDTNANVRFVAATAIGAAGRAQKETDEALLKLFNDPDLRVRGTAVPRVIDAVG
jgi:HEAT repeat protein